MKKLFLLCGPRRIVTGATAGALALALSVPAHAAGVTIPDAGVDVSAYIGAAITALGAAVLTAVGGFFAFLIVRLSLRWARRIA